MPDVLAQADPDELLESCGESPSLICRVVLDRTGNARTAEVADVLLAIPARILLVVLIALVASRVVQRAIDRFTANLSGDQPANRRFKRRLRETRLGGRIGGHVLETGQLSLRSAARAQTIGLVLRSVASALIWTIATITILGEIGINLGPIIAGAGIAGVALGFGAQSLVKDFLTGIFMLIEDQYGVGDIIDVGEAAGTVEAVTLRTTKLRDVEGTVWHVPNGEIARVGNMSQQWARSLLDIGVAYDTDIDRAQAVIKRVADQLWRDIAWRGQILEEPEMWGVQAFGADSVDLRLVVKTQPGKQWAVNRELRRRIKAAFDEAGIEIPFPQRTLWVKRDPGSSVDSDHGDGFDLDAEPAPPADEPAAPADEPAEPDAPADEPAPTRPEPAAPNAPTANRPAADDPGATLPGRRRPRRSVFEDADEGAGAASDSSGAGRSARKAPAKKAGSTRRAKRR